MRITIDTVTDSEDHAKHAIAVICSLYGIPANTPAVLPAPTIPFTGTTLPASHVHPDANGGETTGAHVDTRDPAAVFGHTTAGTGTTGAAAAPAAHPSGVTLDKDGIPWDERIHANAAEKMGQNGFWKKRKGLNDEAKTNAIKAELRQAMAAGGAAVAASPLPTPPAAAAAAAAPVSLLPAPPAGTVTPLPVPPAAAAAAPAPAAAAVPMTFETVMPKIGAAMQAGICDLATVTQVVQQHGLPNLPSMMTRPDLVPAIWSDLSAMFPRLASV